MTEEAEKKTKKDKIASFLKSRTFIGFAPNIGVAVVLIYIGLTLFSNNSPILSAIITLSLAIVVLPTALSRYIVYNRKRQLEEKFPIFLRDFVEAVRGGLTVPDAFKMMSRNDYGELTRYVKKMAAQLEWGIPVDKVLISFSKSTKSALIGRVVSSVIESHRYGGRLTDTFEALSKTAVEVDRLRAERKLFLQSQMTTGYIIFFVFLVVIVVLQQYLVPSITENVQTGLAGNSVDPKIVAAGFKDIFRNLILIQGLFAGLSVGKMAEGALVAGIKHSMIMMFVGGMVFFLLG